jgi:hypothetical protein
MAEEEGLSTQKKVIAGAALGVAVPAAIGVAKKLVGGNGGSDEEESPGQSEDRTRGSQSRTRSSSSSRTRTRSSSGRSSTSTSNSKARSTKTSSGAGKTKEQLYREAKRLKVEGRSQMTKAQLERAVSRSRG